MTSPRRATSTPTATRSRTPASCPRWCRPFTYDGKLQCAPKDYSTLGLVINTDLWAKAGLTDADIPKDWAGLETVAKKLTKGKVTGLVIGNDINRGGAFMVQAGGWVVNKDGSKVTADTPENLAGADRDQEDDGRRAR